MRMRMVTVLAAVVVLGACSSSAKPDESSSTAPLSPATTTTTVARTSPSRTSPTTASLPRTPSAADLAAVRLKLQPVAQGLTSPVDIVFRPGTNQMFVVEQGGALRSVTNGTAAATP